MEGRGLNEGHRYYFLGRFQVQISTLLSSVQEGRRKALMLTFPLSKLEASTLHLMNRK